MPKQPLFFGVIHPFNLWKYWGPPYLAHDVTIIHITVSPNQLYFCVLDLGFIFSWSQLIFNYHERKKEQKTVRKG